MDDEYFEKRLLELKNSKGHKKLLNYLKEFVERESFVNFVFDIRSKYAIPKQGFPVKESNRQLFPANWIGYNNDKISTQYRNDVTQFTKQFELHRLDAMDILDTYIFYNILECPSDHNSCNVCIISDLAEQYEDPFSKETQLEDNRIYPIGIRISPYASLRDIIDFITRMYKHDIKFLQKKYSKQGQGLGKFKTRKDFIRERNDLIYHNQHLPKKEIMHLIVTIYGTKNALEYAYISKIISMENRRRKQL